VASSERDPDEYVARGATIADGPEMLRVLVAAFGRWPEVELTCSALDYLDWKMAAPGITPWHHTVVTRADHVVAVTLTWFAEGELNGTPTAVSHTVDLAVDPAHQGHGLGRMIQQRARGESVLGEIGMDLISKSDAVGHMYAADEIVERPLHTWVRPISARATAARVVHAGTREMGRVVLHALGGVRAARKLPAGVSIEELTAFDERSDELWAAAGRGFAFTRRRDAAYLNWRHADPRSGRRTILGVVDHNADGQLLAWAVLRPHEGTLRVADLLVHPDHQDVGLALLERCARAAATANASALVTWLPVGHPAEALHRAAGFTRSGEEFICQFWPKTARDVPFERVKPLADPNAVLHVTMSDFDFA